MGTTKVFLRDSIADALENGRKSLAEGKILILQAGLRAFNAKLLYQRILENFMLRKGASIVLQSNIRRLNAQIELDRLHKLFMYVFIYIEIYISLFTLTSFELIFFLSIFLIFFSEKQHQCATLFQKYIRSSYCRHELVELIQRKNATIIIQSHIRSLIVKEQAHVLLKHKYVSFLFPFNSE